MRSDPLLAMMMDPRLVFVNPADRARPRRRQQLPWSHPSWSSPMPDVIVRPAAERADFGRCVPPRSLLCHTGSTARCSSRGRRLRP